MVKLMRTQTPGINNRDGLLNTSLVICSRNRPQLLLETVESVLKGDEVPTEVIIIDQSEQVNKPLAQMKHETCFIRYKRSKTVGTSRARNMGITCARYDVIALIDDDMFVTSAWYGALIRALLRVGPPHVITGQVLPQESEAPDGFVPSIKTDDLPAIYEGRTGKDVLFTANMAMFRSVCSRIGLFDERLGPGTPFPAAEDNDFAFRLLEAGSRIFFEPRAVLYHRAWRSEREFVPLHWRYGYGQGAFYAKYLSLADRYILKRFLKDIYNYAARAPFRIWRKRIQAYADAAFTLGLIFGAAHWFMLYRWKRP